METKHTKGQWVKGTNTATRDWMKVFCNGKLIAEAKELSKKGQRKATDFDEEGANVNLIAHAPELLQMVYDLKECIKRLGADDITQFDKDKEAEWVGEAHELLIKANGGAYWKNANKK